MKAGRVKAVRGYYSTTNNAVWFSGSGGHSGDQYFLFRADALPALIEQMARDKLSRRFKGSTVPASAYADFLGEEIDLMAHAFAKAGMRARRGG